MGKYSKARKEESERRANQAEHAAKEAANVSRPSLQLGDPPLELERGGYMLRTTGRGFRLELGEHVEWHLIDAFGVSGPEGVFFLPLNQSGAPVFGESFQIVVKGFFNVGFHKL